MLIQKKKKNKNQKPKQKQNQNQSQCVAMLLHQIFTNHPTLTTTVSTINNNLIELQHYLKSVFLQLKNKYNFKKKIYIYKQNTRKIFMKTNYNERNQYQYQNGTQRNGN